MTSERAPTPDPSLLRRKIIHFDMDAFYASIEIRDQPSLQGKPIVVGGNPDGRGVVATASYEAREFGIHSAMPAARARRLCPHAVFLRPRMAVYREVAREIRRIFREHASKVEPLSLDEAYLDVTDPSDGSSATSVAREVKAEIRRATGLTGSAGVAPNKMVAKIASDMRKPDGLTVVPPARVRAFMGGLAVKKIPGVGQVTEARLARLGITRCSDVWDFTRTQLRRRLGKQGIWLYKRSRGLDDRPVVTERIPKQQSHEETFAVDRNDLPGLCQELKRMADRVAGRLKRLEARGRTIVLKVRYADFSLITRSHTVNDWVDDGERIARIASRLLKNRTEVGPRKCRLIGVGVQNLDLHEGWEAGDRQLLLFDDLR